MPSPPHPLPLLAAKSLVPGLAEAYAGPTVPFPALLLDQAMPRLTDTEWRLLCVVVRQTLGWHDKETGGRKERDWLTQSQLVARTGRTAKPVAEAIAALTAQQVIRVLSDGGQVLVTPKQRQNYFGRHWFQLHPYWPTSLTAPAQERQEEGGERSEGEARREAETRPKLVRPVLNAPCGESPQPESMPAESPQPAEGPQPFRLWQMAREVFTSQGVPPVEKVYTTPVEKVHTLPMEFLHTTKETHDKRKTQKKNEGRVDFLHRQKVYTRERQTENRQTEKECAGSGRERWKASLPERRPGSEHQEIPPREEVTAGSGETALTIYGPSTPQVRSVWEQEAAGQRWTWRKDLKRWVKDEGGEEKASKA